MAIKRTRKSRKIKRTGKQKGGNVETINKIYNNLLEKYNQITKLAGITTDLAYREFRTIIIQYIRDSFKPCACDSLTNKKRLLINYILTHPDPTTKNYKHVIGEIGVIEAFSPENSEEQIKNLIIYLYKIVININVMAFDRHPDNKLEKYLYFKLLIEDNNYFKWEQRMQHRRKFVIKINDPKIEKMKEILLIIFDMLDGKGGKKDSTLYSDIADYMPKLLNNPAPEKQARQKVLLPPLEAQGGKRKSKKKRRNRKRKSSRKN